MSNYVAPAFHPKTGRVVQAHWLDNFFWFAHLSFDNDTKIYKSSECGLEAAGQHIDLLNKEIKELLKCQK